MAQEASGGSYGRDFSMGAGRKWSDVVVGVGRSCYGVGKFIVEVGRRPWSQQRCIERWLSLRWSSANRKERKHMRVDIRGVLLGSGVHPKASGVHFWVEKMYGESN